MAIFVRNCLFKRITLCYYDHGAKASEAVQKIAIDQKEYGKCSLYVIIC